MATENEPDKWIEVAKGKLKDVRGLFCRDQPGKKTFEFETRYARYAKFEAVSFFGKGAVLQYFDMQ